MKRRELPVVAGVTVLLMGGLAGCAVGTGGADDSDVEYSADATLEGNLEIMGFSGVDEVATSRMDLTEQALGDVEVKLTEGELDLQQLLSAIATGEPPDLIYADRDEIGSLAARGALLPLERCVD